MYGPETVHISKRGHTSYLVYFFSKVQRNRLRKFTLKFLTYTKFIVGPLFAYMLST